MIVRNILWIIFSFVAIAAGSLKKDRAPNAFEFLSRRSNIEKRSPEDYYDYDYAAYDVGLAQPPAPAPAPAPEVQTATEKSFDGLQIFMDGLNKLQEALHDPDHDWSQMGTSVPPDDHPDTPASEDGTASDLHDLLVLVRVLKQLSQEQTTTTPSPEDHLVRAKRILEGIVNAFSLDSSPEDRHRILATIDPEGHQPSVDEAVDQVSQLFKQVFGEEASGSLPPPADLGSPVVPQMLVNTTLVLLENAQTNYLNQMSTAEEDAGDTTGHLQRLRDVIQELQALSDSDARTTPTTTTTTTTTTTPKPNSLPCIAPYVDIAYKMCILPILDKVFSYDDALEHCRDRGLQLAMDSVVIKSRKYLNELLGERGTRERWPVWVGAKKQEGGESRWMWEDGNTVPNFLWSKRQPRTYNVHSIPEGTCMILDGFNEYYGSSLPCHLRRRFICQKTY